MSKVFTEIEFKETFNKVISDQLLKPDFVFKPEDKIYEHMDSLDLVELVMSVEDEFSIEISDDEVESITLFSQFDQVVRSKVEIRN